MKLTRRQEEFISNLLDLHDEVEGPIHYSILAERLGVSPFTAYDMLCVLEEKGFVRSEYQLSGEKSGPGRAERVFFPSETAQAREKRLAKQIGVEKLTGEHLKAQIMQKMRTGEVWDREFAEQMIARIPPEGQGSILYCVEVMTIVSLRLRQSEGLDLFRKYFPNILPTKSSSCRANLTMLGGFSFGLLAQECSADQEWVQTLYEHVKHYQNIVINMSMEDCRQLADYLVTVFRPISDEN